MSAPDVGRTVDLLARLVAFDTQNPPGQEHACAAMLVEELRGFGMEASTRPVARPGFEGRSNAVGILRNGDGPVVALNSHIDIVPVGTGWTSDPLRLVERDGRLFGRGACDAKGPVAAMTEACRLLAADRGAWRGTLVAMFVADEELNGSGSISVAAEFPAFDGIIVGEPTENAVLAAHRGCVRPLIRVHGTTAHSSRPYLGVNAIDGAAKLIGAINAYDKRINQRSHKLVGCACVSTTRIFGGFGDNIIPDRCDIVLDRRLLPGETVEGVTGELQEVLDEARAADNVIAELFEMRAAAPGCETPEDAAVVQAALKAAAKHGASPLLGGLTGGCDLVHFRSKGSPGIVLGPGSLDQAHKPDEYVAKDALAQASAIYRDTLLAMFNP